MVSIFSPCKPTSDGRSRRRHWLRAASISASARPRKPIAKPSCRASPLSLFYVPSYDEGARFFRDGLGFEAVEDTDLGQNNRWIVVAPPRRRGATLILAVPADRNQRARIGDQTGGRVGYFLLTNDFQADYKVLRSRADGHEHVA
ncbi:VOC family protein [Roseiarcus sp.]|uniref:VOC family protein n=1 Tax=Roseiarcus sp. TaxID=1969460 RepID=UPI003C75C2DE